MLYRAGPGRRHTAATTWPRLQAKQLLIVVLCLYSLWLLHLDTKALKYFTFLFFHVTETLFRCRIVGVAELKIVACPALPWCLN